MMNWRHVVDVMVKLQHLFSISDNVFGKKQFTRRRILLSGKCKDKLNHGSKLSFSDLLCLVEDQRRNRSPLTFVQSQKGSNQ